MASINRHKRELLFKVVFYGPGLGGKTTTLRHVYAATKPDNRGNMVSLATDTDRTLYFDYLPIQLLKLGEMTVKLLLYTVPGQVYYAATRKLVLNGADGIVFVADTQAARLEANHESLDDLNANLAEQGRKLSAVPHAFQWNKRDLPNLVPVDELDRRLNLFGAPSMPTIATTGEGVFDTLERVTRLVVEAYRADLPPGSARQPQGVPLSLDAEEIGLHDAIRGLTDSQPTARAASSGRRPGAEMATMAASAATSAVALARAINVSVGGAAQASALEAQPALATNPSPSGSGTFSFAELWPSADRETVRRAEQALATGDASAGVLACEDLLSRALASGSVLLGGQQSHPRDPGVLITLLGLDGVRYLAFRGIARGARGNRTILLREALDCYAFVLEARRALDRAMKSG